MENNIEILKRLLKNDSPILFLGAGFSIGAKLLNGNYFPKGDGLKEVILEKFLKIAQEDKEYEELSNYSLSKVCQYARNIKSETHLNDFISDFLKNSKPSSFHKKITTYNWRKIYTTNIDDIIESIFRDQNKDLLIQNFSRKSTLHKDCTEYIKLHGCVNNPSEGIVFSTEEYVESMTRPKDYRFNSLCLDINSEDFIFIGSEFEEINIDFYLKLYENSGYKSSRGKLIFINPSPSLFLKSKIAKIGATIIQWTTEEFLNFLVDFLNLDSNKIDEPKIRLDKSGFSLIQKSKTDTVNLYDSNLYLGYEPEWNDLFFDWDFLNEDLLKEFESFKKYISDKETGIFSICGKAFSGKSVFIRRLAVELINENYDVYYFKGRHFNFYPFYQHIMKSESLQFALVIDDASYHYKAIKQLSRFNFKGKQLLIITSSRPFYHYRKRYHFIEERFREYTIETQITADYAEGIVNKLEEKGYLGELKKYDLINDRKEQIVSRSDIFSLLSFITQGSGFKERMLKEIVPIVRTNPLVNDLLLKTAIFEELDLPHFPKELVTNIYSEKTSHILSLADDFLKFNNKGDIQFRAKFYAKNLIKVNGKRSIIEAIQDVLIFISPQISESNQRAGNSYWCEIQEALTKQRLLKNIFNLKKQDIKQLLTGIQSYYGENSHFWLQLGIAEQSLGEFEKALNHFKQAEALNPNSYIIQHAIGRNFMKHANAIETELIACSHHDEGVRILIPIIENQEEYSARAFSTHSYLNEELHYIEKFNINVSNAHLKKLFSYLRKIIDKDPEDVMSKHMSNYFYKFLQRTNKLNVISISFRDLSNFKSFFQDYNTSIDELLEEQE
jgi:tetratricopeptide (TPR) repeat protein